MSNSKNGNIGKILLWIFLLPFMAFAWGWKRNKKVTLIVTAIILIIGIITPDTDLEKEQIENNVSTESTINDNTEEKSENHKSNNEKTKENENIIENSDTSDTGKTTSSTEEKDISNNETKDTAQTSSNENIVLTELKVHFIDVGQADAIFIDYGDYDILIDAGNNGDGDLVVDYLEQLNTDDIEIMVATHPHEDHIGGLDDVLSAFKVGVTIDSGLNYESATYNDYLSAALNEENSDLIYDDNISFDLGNGISFKVIETGDNFENTNDYSVVTMLDYYDIEFLFTGDMEAHAELGSLNLFDDIEVLKVGHHGSSTSTSQEFLDVIKPEYAVISCGEGNRYGHPHIETLKKLNDRNISIYRTDEQGSIVATTDGETVSFDVSPVIVDLSQNEDYDNSSSNNTSTSNDNKVNDNEIIIKSIDKSEEIVVIENSSNEDVIMTGWKLVSVTGSQEFVFPDYTLKAGNAVSIYCGSDVKGDIKWQGRPVWNNSSSDPGELYDNKGNLVYRYND